MIAHLFVLKIEDHTIPKIRRRNSWHIISAPTPLANMSWGGFCTATFTIFQSPEALFVQKQGLTSFVGCNYMWDGWHSNVPVAIKLYQHLISTKCIKYMYLDMYICSFTYTIICFRNMKSHTHTHRPPLIFCLFQNSLMEGFDEIFAVPCPGWLPDYHTKLLKWQAHERLLGGLSTCLILLLKFCMLHRRWFGKDDHDLIAVFTCLFVFLVNELNLSKMTHQPTVATEHQ